MCLTGVLIFIACIIAGASAQRVVNECEGLHGGAFVRDPARCNGFFTCDGQGGRIPGTCPAPFWFDLYTQSCNWPSLVGDCFQCPPEIPFRDVAVNNTCSRFIRCTSGVAVEMECPNGTLFNSNIGTCDLTANVNCSIPEVPRDICPIELHGQLVANPRNCSK